MSIQLAALSANIALTVLKFIVGTVAGSRALIADGFNSAGDVLATFIAWIAFRYGLRPPDANHHYGHQNAEAIAGLLIGGMLVATGTFITIDGVLALASDKLDKPPGTLAMYAAAATAVVKEILYRASIRVGEETRSLTLLASARDHRADVVSALFAFAGIAIARTGWLAVDPLAACAVGVYILWLGFAPLRSNIAVLMHEAPAEIGSAARDAALGDGVLHVAQVRVQPLGGRYRMDMVLEVDGAISVARAHEIAHAAERRVQERVAHVTEVHVHVEPLAAGEDRVP